MRVTSDRLFLELERLTPGTDEFIDLLTQYRAARRHELEETESYEAAVTKWHRDRRAEYYRDVFAIFQKAVLPLFHLIWISWVFFWLFDNNGRNLDELFNTIFIFLAHFTPK